MMQLFFSCWICLAMNFLLLFAESQHLCGETCNESSRDLEIHSTTEWEAELQAKCFTACVDMLPAYCNCNISLQPTMEGYWNTFDYEVLKTVECVAYQKVKDCQRGCVIQGRNANFTKNECRDECYRNCPNSCDDGQHCDSYETEHCNIQCRPPVCSIGCTIYSNELHNIIEGPSPPSSPSEPIMFPIKHDDGYFVYSTINTANPLPESSGGGLNDVSAFVFKIEAKSFTAFIWRWTYYGYMDLEFATCQEVQVSFKAVSKYGKSDYSPALNICVHGYPAQVKNPTFDYAEDFRPGFLGHANTTISWTKPEGWEFLSNYRLTIFSQTEGCGGLYETYEYTIDKDATNVTISAKLPNHPIKFGCRYLIRLISEPNELEDENLTTIFINPELSIKSSMTIYCSVSYQSNGKVNLNAVWTLSESPGIIEAIERFAVSPQKIDSDHIAGIVSEYYTEISVKPNVNETVNVVVVRNLDPLMDSNKYKLRVDAVSNGMFPWRQMPSYVTCILDAYPKPSSAINSTTVDIHHLDFNNVNLFLNLSWLHPSEINGIIEIYQLRIAREPLGPDEMDDSNDYSLKITTKGNETTSEINTTDIYKKETLPCLYLQIRCENNYNLWSNWSEPIFLHKYPDVDPNCRGIVPSSTISTNSPEPTLRAENKKEDVNVPPHIAGAVAGSIVGLFVLVTLCVTTTILCRRYHRRNRYLQEFKNVSTDPMYVKGRSPNPTDTLNTKLLNSPKLDEWEIPAGQVMIENRLGEGCFGEVYQGMIKGRINNSKIQASLKNAICPVVAIKLLKSTASGSERVDFLQEIDTMKKVAKGNNPHVVNMVGCVTIQEPLCLITEFVKHGDLSSYLTSIRKMITQRKFNAKPGGPEPYLVPNHSPDSNKHLSTASDSPYSDLGEIDTVNLLSFAYQIASGMEYLASLGIVHRDLACRNILVGEGKSLKISDFGMSRAVGVDDVYVKNTKGRLPWKWMAIESIMNREFTSSSDVWAYGVTIWEIATLGGFPYPAITNAELLEHLQKGLRLEKPDNCSIEVYAIMVECWMGNPGDRPTFSLLRAKFDSLISAQKDHIPYIDLDIDCCKPYYNQLLNSDDDSEENRSSNGGELSTESSSLPLDIDNSAGAFMRPISSEDLLRPISNTYVDSPTKINLAFDVPSVNCMSGTTEFPFVMEEHAHELIISTEVEVV